jgi:ABC-type Co2+ transport system permease subunit
VAVHFFLLGDFSIEAHSGAHVHFFEGEDALILFGTSDVLFRSVFVKLISHFFVKNFVCEEGLEKD